MNNYNEYDVVIIGGGPAGCSAAAILAEAGRKVLVLEREKFPRYKVGESLIPFTYHPLKRLGLIDRMRASHFVKKYSVQFVSPSGQTSQPFYFSSRYDENVAQTWQVLRSEFDQILMENAREKGAAIWEETCACELISEGNTTRGVRIQRAAGGKTALTASMTLDCSGKEAFVATKKRWRKRDPRLNKVAVWTYYRGAMRDKGIDAGATTVAFVPEKGWFWYIPQHQDMVSVGVVAEGSYLTRGGLKDPAAIFKREIGQNLWIEEHLSPGKQIGKHYVTSEYTFRSEYCAEEGLLLLGDAFGFLDPVFSSGLLLALKSGVLAGEAVDRALREGSLAPSQFKSYSSTMRQGIENMRKLVYAFYDPNFSFRRLTEKYPHLAGEVTDCLSGDVNKDFSRLWKAIGEFAALPEELPYGTPMPDAKKSSRPNSSFLPGRKPTLPLSTEVHRFG